jgi:hypothetical protein
MKILKWYRVLGLVVVVAMFITVTACSKSDEDKAGTEGETTAMEAATDFVNDERKAAVEALRGTYDGFNQKFEEFKGRNAFNFGEQYRNLRSNIEEEQARIELKFIEARGAAEEKWQEIKADITATMEKLEQAMIDFES